MTENLGVTAQETKRSLSPTPALPGSDRSLLKDLAAAIDARLAPLLSGHSRCALFGFPTGANVGDSALWVAETSWLERAGIDVVYACNRFTYSRSRLRRELKDGVILWHGGGNLGDLWPVAQAFREQVISESHDNPIVQLPQSVTFRDPRNAERAAGIMNQHPNLKLLARDPASLERAHEIFAVECSLCPDMAFALDLPEQRSRASRDVLWLMRDDIESAEGNGETPTGELTLDWLSDVPSQLRRPWTTYSGYTANRWFSAGIRRWPRWLPAPSRAVAATYNRRARQRLDRGWRTLMLGRVVVTNRLHGHILACILGQPHVVLGDRYGKLRSFYDKWSSEFSVARFADTYEEAHTLARELLTEYSQD